ncbi:MAG TPA: metallophosphoesterase [Opitutaceae bacterium]|nr:metallophosphoesterase [Opitutaceae bacterium]
MRLLFVADIHYALKQFDWLVARAGDYDAVAIGGDLLDLSSPLECDVQIIIVEKYLARLREKTRVLVCSGNHDGDSRNEADESVAAWLRYAKADGLFVDFDHVDLGGNLVTICPWWDGPLSRSALERMLVEGSLQPRQKWIWLHHAPPDQFRVSWTGRKFAGDTFLVEWIHRFQPDLVLSGHVHNAPFYPDGSWIDRVGRTWVFNPGRQIGATPAFVDFDLDAMTADWVSLGERDSQALAASDTL